uniref:NADH-ubiquinone oxidoreductase chain 6 n=1 Tax=Trypodendron domesticum TaxID=1220309 RepID=A0A343A6E2_9CUCU|nr:NADH dehydrogenase subunit 6 [Trypodendron domesticum]AOY40121.1 NADH dehydrogenase subunit 6 [Trypodendron domesticum]
MTLYFLVLNTFMSIFFMSMKHPLSLGFILLIQTILISLSSGILYLNFWFSYLLFLIMISGMLIMFIYMTSIASNEKFKMPKYTLVIFYTMMTMIITIMIFQDKMMPNSMNEILTMISQSINNIIINKTPTLTKMFNFPKNKLIIMIMLYLLITLIAIVKITEKKMGPLRQK